ncbi:MAG: rod shape-determining protein RodA [Bacteroidota bacterium]|nr:rod shape-determining protein RodA [Bacteroidota bacterium]MDE2834365.1 rod shape-determining protein RodA [Bacteroidota bacterium]MDE2955464.1 rod shape-determining protein RodA [Bacteroidota bacterium]
MRTWYRNLDWLVVVVWLALCGVGLIAIYSTTYGSSQEFLLTSVQRNFDRQLLWLCICGLALVVSLLIPVRLLIQLAPVLYGASIVLILAALAIGREVGGAQAWVYIGPFGFQSSELAKVGAIVMVALILAKKPVRGSDALSALSAIGLLLLPAALIMLQNDDGTALVFISLIPLLLFWGSFPMTIVLLMVIPAIAGYMTVLHWPTALGFAVVITGVLYVSTRNMQLAILAGSIAGGTVGFTAFALHRILRPHQVQRILAFANPEADEFRSGVGFHLIQSKTAIGSGGLFGQGFMEGSQTQGRYIPEQSTDFIFSAIGEEWGFVGSLLVLLLFGLLIIRLLRMAARTHHPFGSLVIAGAASVFFVHVCVNIGMVLGLLPVIGIPLPFLSYGGSALLTNSVLLGLSLNMYARRDEFSMYF